MKVKVLESRNKKNLGKIFDLGKVISGNLNAPNRFDARLKFEKPLQIGKDLFYPECYINTGYNNAYTVKLVNVTPDKFGNERFTYFDLVEILQN